MSDASLILASASPRRRELLARVGIEHRVIPADIDESVRAGEAAVPYAQRVALDKARTVSERHPDAPVLAADTVVAIDGNLLGKPTSAEHARRMIAQLSGRTHRVTTAIAFAAGSDMVARTVTTEVDMRRACDTELDDYVLSGEWQGKAGGYAVQGIAAVFVQCVRGSITNVIGLPLAEVVDVLQAHGIDTRLDRGVPA